MSDVVKDAKDSFASAERILLDVVSWVILIPKTLFAVLADPAKAARGVQDELARDRSGRWEEGISPVFLYLIVALGPLLLSQFFDLPKVSITGVSPTTAVLSPHTLGADPAELPPSRAYALEWSIRRLPMGDVGIEPELVARVRQEFLPDLQGRFRETVARTGSVDATREALASTFGVAAVDSIAAFWCSPPAYEGCEGSQALAVWDLFLQYEPDEAAALAGDYDATLVAAIASSVPGPIDDPVGLEAEFEALVGSVGVDQARASLVERYPADEVTRYAAYWCSPPAFEGCEDSDVLEVWEIFEQDEPAAARAIASARFDPELVAAVYEMVAPMEEPLETVEDEDPRAVFLQLMELGFSASAAAGHVAGRFREGLADTLYARECSVAIENPREACLVNAPGPPGAAWYRLAWLIESEGRSAVDAAVEVATTHGRAPAYEAYTYWCSPPAYPSCGETSELAPECRSLADGLSENPYQISCTWLSEGTYYVDLEVEDLATGKLLDRSDRETVEVTFAGSENTGEKKDEATRLGNEAGTAPAPGNGRSLDLAKWFRNPQTIRWALLFLAVPLYLSFLVLRLGKLSRETITPSFHVQCLFGAPLVLGVWIPVLVGRYVPEPSGHVYWIWGSLALVLATWWVAAQVSFTAAIREWTKPRAFGLLTGFLLLPALVLGVVDAFTGGLNKFQVVESLALVLVGLLAIPLLTGLLRRTTGRVS